MVSEPADDPCGIAHGHAVVWNIAGNDASCTDDAPMANGDAGQEDGTASNPAVLAHGNGAGAFDGLATFFVVGGVDGRVDLHARPNEGMVAYGDVTAIEEGAVGVDEDVLA